MKIEKLDKRVELPPFDVPVRLFRTDNPRAMAIVVPAMGTVAGFYQPFAEELAARGFSVLVPELPGTGASLPRPSWSVNYGYPELIEAYLPTIVAAARKAGQGVPVVLFGHSLGAHAGTLAVAAGRIEIDALVTVAGGNIHFRNWDGAGSLKVLSAATLFTSLTWVFGHMPGQYVGFGGPQARSLIRQWSRIIFTGRFSHIVPDMNPGKAVPSLCIGYEGDDLAPEKSVLGLADVLGSELRIMPVSWPGNPHSSWARNPVETVSLVESWLEAQHLTDRS